MEPKNFYTIIWQLIVSKTIVNNRVYHALIEIYCPKLEK